MGKRRTARVCGLLAACVLLAGADAAGAQPAEEIGVAECSALDSLGLALQRHVRRVGGSVGVAAIHIESGARVSLHGDRRFPMASVYKIPIALQYLRRVDRGELRLTDTLRLEPEEFRPGHSPLAVAARGRPIRVTADSLLRLMLTHSDNTATDVILRLAGGPDAVTGLLREMGIREMRVDRSEARTFADLWGIPDSVPESRLGRRATFLLRDRIPPAVRERARTRYGEDPRDTSTPNAMAELLVRAFEGEGLGPETHALLLGLLTETPTGPRRLRGLLPAATVVAHKTGTMAGAINDVGIVTLPEGGGHLAVAVFVNTLRASTRQRESTIARVSRSLYDHFAPPRRVPYALVSASGSCGVDPGA